MALGIGEQIEDGFGRRRDDALDRDDVGGITHGGQGTDTQVRWLGPVRS